MAIDVFLNVARDEKRPRIAPRLNIGKLRVEKRLAEPLPYAQSQGARATTAPATAAVPFAVDLPRLAADHAEETDRPCRLALCTGPAGPSRAQPWPQRPLRYRIRRQAAVPLRF